MAKIDFGFNNDNQLNAQFEGYDNTGDFVEIVRINDSDCLISNINGRYDAKEIAQDVYADGSYSTYANGLTTNLKSSLLIVLNRPHIKERINNGEKVIDVLRESGFEVMPSNLRPVITGYENIPGVVTSINPAVFEDLKNTQRYTHTSFYNLCKEVELLREKLTELEQTKGL